MPKALFLFHDGKFLRSDKLLISPDNRSFRYGDGFFETMKWKNGQVMLQQLHLERLFHSLELLKFKPPTYFTAEYIVQAIQELVKKNQHHTLARIRLTIFRGEGGIYDHQNHFPHLLIQSWDLNESNNQLNENGLDIDIYRLSVKSADHFSSIKSNNYLPYVMAAIWAKEQNLNDAILLNADGNIADATIANVFMVKDGFIKTPPLSDAAVAGVMRRHLLNQLNHLGYEVRETSIAPAELLQASEIFLTNAIYGIRWVKQLENVQFTSLLTAKIFKEIT
ncbi:MAG: aminotransferase class IV [Sediminibacterium sp.]|nr:aminotransferase class IV [Sediminibacterium sp.]